MTKKPAKSEVAELEVTRVPLQKLKPHPQNPRRHPDPGTPQWEALKASLAHDYFDPIVWNKRSGMLVSGHLRVKVLKEMGYRAADAVIVNYDERTHLARMLAANRFIGTDDEHALLEVLRDLDNQLPLSTYLEEDLRELLTRLNPEAPAEFDQFDENLPVEHKCPKCGYQWSGKPS